MHGHDFKIRTQPKNRCISFPSWIFKDLIIHFYYNHLNLFNYVYPLRLVC